MILTDSKYGKLLKDLRQVIEEGKKRVEAASRDEVILTYWQVGKRISEEKLIENAGYGESILTDLSEDLGIDVRTLQRSALFFEKYKIAAPRGRNLSWSHYRELIKLEHDGERAWYEDKAEAEEWSRDELLQAIEREAFEKGKTRKPSKASLEGIELSRPTDSTYVYKAEVMRVVDADTLLLRIDLGFQVWKEQRIRLAHVDAKPMDDPEGYRAFEFVRDQLAQAPYVMVRTHKIDIYGRYVGDVFYDFKITDLDRVFKTGRYLNQEILALKLAKRV